jgi:thioredoxin-dependent peroxiredoxin
MIDPPKATKGRRMSKKTRKKLVKASAGKAPRAESGRPTKVTAAKTGRATTNKSAKGKKAVTAKPRATAAKPGAAAGKATTPKTTLVKATARKAEVESRAVSKSPPKAAPQIDSKSAAEGAKAPAFRLPRDGGEIVSLADFKGRKLVLFFYPRADTPGCTKEAIDFTRLASSFAESQTAILGISADPLKAQETFRDKHELSIPLVSDEEHETLDAYGAWGEKSMYGRTFHGVLRTTVLIGADGRIARIWRHVKVDGHADEVLAAARAL